VNPILHRFAILVAVCALLLVMSGAIVTTQGPDSSLKPLHQIFAVAVSVLGLGLAIWLMTIRSFWIGGLILVAEAATGMLGSGPASAERAALHAMLAQVFIAMTWAAVVVTSRGWIEGKDPVPDQGWPSLRSLAIVMPVLVLAQVGLGAAVRHKADVVLWHLAGAMIVALLALCECMFVSQPYPKHGTLRPAANLLLGVVCTQVFLGIAVYAVRLTLNDVPYPQLTGGSADALLLSTVGHVTVGALTLAATLGLSLQIRHNVFPKPPEE
jgi:hypothetical protein